MFLQWASGLNSKINFENKKMRTEYILPFSVFSVWSTERDVSSSRIVSPAVSMSWSPTSSDCSSSVGGDFTLMLSGMNSIFPSWESLSP